MRPARDAEAGELWREPVGFGLVRDGRLLLGLREGTLGLP